MRFLKDYVVPVVFPMSICLELLVLAIGLAHRRRRRASHSAMWTALIVFALSSYTLTTDLLLEPLETRYRPLDPDSLTIEAEWIVVLGAGHASDSTLPPNAKLSGETLARLLEGLRLHRRFPSAKLLLSGGPDKDRISDAEVMSETAQLLGVAREKLVLESESLNTEHEARLIAPIVGSSRVILVTSASHMPRAIALFAKSGLQPIPAPTYFQNRQHERFSSRDLFPQPSNFENAHRALYEYLGLVSARLRGKL